MLKVLAKLFDSEDNGADLHLVLSALGVLTFLGLEIYRTVVCGESFNGTDFGTGLGLVFAGSGVVAGATGVQRKLQAPPAPVDPTAPTPGN